MSSDDVSNKSCKPFTHSIPAKTVVHAMQFKDYNTEIFLYKPWRPKGFFQFKTIINVLVSSFRFFLIPTCDWLQLYVQKVICSEGPMFRRFYVQKVLCSEGPMFKRFHFQKVLYSEGSMFRRFYAQKYLIRRSYVQNVRVTIRQFQLGTRRFCDVALTSMTLIQCRKNVVCPPPGGFSSLNEV